MRWERGNDDENREIRNDFVPATSFPFPADEQWSDYMLAWARRVAVPAHFQLSAWARYGQALKNAAPPIDEQAQHVVDAMVERKAVGKTKKLRLKCGRF